MTQLYTGRPYKGQNNLTIQGCFHAGVTHGESATRELALEGLKVWQDRTQGRIDSSQATSRAALLEQRLNTIPTEEQPQLAWALAQLRHL